MGDYAASAEPSLEPASIGHDPTVIGGRSRRRIARDSAVNGPIEEILGPICSLGGGRRSPDGENALPLRRVQIRADPRHALRECDGRQPQPMVAARPLDDDGVSRPERNGSLAHTRKNRTLEARRYKSRDFPHARALDAT